MRSYLRRCVGGGGGGGAVRRRGRLGAGRRQLAERRRMLRRSSKGRTMGCADLLRNPAETGTPRKCGTREKLEKGELKVTGNERNVARSPVSVCPLLFPRLRVAYYTLIRVNSNYG